jgi:hypothetical protein
MVEPRQATHGLWRKADVLAKTALQMATGYANRRGERFYVNPPVRQTDGRERLLHRVSRSASAVCKRKQKLVDVY